MVGYPNKKDTYKEKNTSAAHRGMTLERDINDTNKYYLETDRAAIYKKPTPITIVNVDYKSRETAKITEAYFQIPSTTDYNGVYRGQYIDFEAKETHSRTSMPLSMIHQHQLDHLARVVKYGGIAFLIVRFAVYDETYYVSAKAFLEKISSSSARSVKYEWFQENCILIPYNYVVKVNYLQVVDRIIDEGDFK
jgi:recombination protein U